LIHISEIADIAVAEPLKTIRVGDAVKAKVLRVDRKRQRVGLSLRQAEEGGSDEGSTGEAPNDSENGAEENSENNAGSDAQNEEVAQDEEQ